MDECASNNPCGMGAECVNRGGSFACICPSGFVLENSAELQIEQNQNFSSLYANALNNFYRAVVDDIDGPSENDVSNTALSTISNAKTGAGLACIDVDECNMPSGAAKCGTNAKCINFPGSYRCLCPSGFQGQGYLHCES